jgi:DNA modification methylase
MTNKIKLENKSCLSYLKTLEDESVDLVLVDPPYFIDYEDWDNQWETEQEYLDWCKNWVEESYRVLKPNSCFYVWGTTKTDLFLRFKLEVMNATENLHYQNWIVWSYDWGGRTKKKWARKHEDLLFYSKEEDFPFYDGRIRVPYKMESNIRDSAENDPRGKIPTDVWEKNNHTASKEYCSWHSTQKPLSLLERIIKAHTEKGDTVLDFFSGSGSTMIASYNTGRKFKGCEIDTEYYKKSLDRFENLKDDKEWQSEENPFW